jgi:hypothetical protein
MASPAPVQVQQPSSGVGSTAETNRLLGGNYFDEKSGAQVKTFTPTVVTDANVREKAIPETLNNFNQMMAGRNGGNPNGSTPGSTPGANGGTSTPAAGDDNSDVLQSLYKSLGLDQTPDSSNNDEMALLEKIKASSDAATAAHIDTITRQYGDLEGRLKDSQGRADAGLEHVLLNAGAGGQGGLSRYSPQSAANLTKMKANSDVQALMELHNKENTAIATAETAKQNKDYQLLQQQVKVIQGVRNQKATLAKQIGANLIKENNTAAKAKVKASRDAAVVSLVGQGITDPQDLLGYLNYDNAGNQTGDFTAEEITKTLKNIAPAGDTAGLSGNVKNFYALKSTGRLPGNISSLPEDHQLYSYLQYLHNATKISSGNPKAPSTKKLTLSEVQSLGLPTALIGESEKSILESFSQEHPPEWFMHRLVAEQGNDNYADTKWQEFQKAHINPPAKKTTTSSSSTNLYGN